MDGRRLQKQLKHIQLLPLTHGVHILALFYVTHVKPVKSANLAPINERKNYAIVQIHVDSTVRTLSRVEAIDQKRVRLFHQGFQTPRKIWKHDAEGGVLSSNIWRRTWLEKNFNSFRSLV